MACRSFKLPDGTTGIMCGSFKKPKPCVVCGSRSIALCDWKIEKPASIHHSSLASTDVIVTRQAGFHLPVQGLNRFIENGHVRFPVTMYGLNFPEKRGSWVYYLFGKDTVRVLRPATCDAPVCDLHRRQVGEDRDYCMAHWGDWERQ